MKKILFVLYFLFTNLFGFEEEIQLTILPGSNGKTTICMHGMGGDYRIAEITRHFLKDDTLVSFNFPDHNMAKVKYDAHQTCFGTFKELVPPLLILKKLIVDEGKSAVNLYGFSAGGGAIINLVAALNTNKHDKALSEIGIKKEEKAKILSAIQNGIIILDTPLKSISEIIDFRGNREDLVIIGKRYKENGFEPIESIKYLKNLSLHIIVHFQTPDEVLSNRDDLEFIERLQSVNKLGKTAAFIGSDNGHMLPHYSLWRYLNKM